MIQTFITHFTECHANACLFLLPPKMILGGSMIYTEMKSGNGIYIQLAISLVP